MIKEHEYQLSKENEMNISAIVLAAGNGKRMGADIPKQFLKINGEYILTKTLRVFQDSSVISDIVLVTGEHYYRRKGAL